MVARIVIPLFLLIVLTDVYIDFQYLRKRKNLTWWQRLSWWTPTILLVLCLLYTSPSPRDS